MRLSFILLFASFLFFQKNSLPLLSKTLPASTPAIDTLECIAMEMQRKLFFENRNRRILQQALENSAYQFFTQKSNGGAESSLLADYTLPVVFHIIHQNGPENITDAQILTAFDNLNDAFANSNFYGGNDGVDTKIQFCLAKRDPNGNATTGINRVVSPLTNVNFSTDIAMKNLIRWNPKEYINIWLVRSINGGGVAGYAYFPSSHGGPEDGIVMLGSIMPNLGGGHSTLVHEMGHYLGLYHTFEGGCTNNNCLLDGDRVCDTPPDNTTAPPGDCSAIVNSCSTDTQSGFASDQNDINWNFVDYGNQPCRNGYTQGQAGRMAFFIENVRQSLLNSQACQDPCLNAIVAGFTSSATMVNVGETVNFTNTSTGGNAYSWSVNGAQFATTPNASYAFNSLGTFEIILNVTNADPSCSGSDTSVIEVVCPINASFNTSNLYPAPGEIVSFTNTSSGANNFIWTVNGNTVPAGTNFSTDFSSPGQYNICMLAGNGLCSEQFCQLVFVIDTANGGECESSFIRRFGDFGVNEESFYLISGGNGNYFLGGRDGANSLIIQIDPSGNILTQRTYNFTNGNDFIANLMVDSEGYLVGSARDQLNSNTTNILFKIDWSTGNLLWARKVDNPAYNRFDRVFQHPVSGNYMFCGMTTNAIDNYIIEANKNTGVVTWQLVSDYGNNGDVYSGYSISGNAIYYAGQGRLGAGLDDIRPTLTKFDLNGNMQWAKIHLRSPNQPSRLYNMDLFVENDTIVNCGRGSLTSDNLSTSQLLFYKTNINGNLILARSYSIAGSSGVAGYRIHPIPDGYVVQGTFDEGGVTARLFIARLNKVGNVVWAKKIITATAAASIIRPLTAIDGGFIVFAAQTSQFDNGSNDDLLFGKISLDGQVVGTNCNLVSDINLVGNAISNPYDGSHLPTVFSANYLYPVSTHNALSADLAVNDISGCECTDFTPAADTCTNGLPVHTMPDAMLQNISGQCNGDSLLISFQVCNTDSVTLPAGTPLSFYQNNPTVSTANLLTTVMLPSAVDPGVCEQFNLMALLPTNQQIFAVVNDDGTTPTPFDLSANFPNTAINECDYSNNIVSFAVNYIAPQLDLGPDINSCHFEVTELDAGAGFAGYQWSVPGNVAQTFTAWEPGSYSVTVTDVCGGTQTDDISITVVPSSIIEIGVDTAQICEGGNATFSVNGFSSYQWFPPDLVDCSTCPAVTVSPETDTCLIVLAAGSDGCYSADTVCLRIVQAPSTFDTIQFCQGETVIVFGNPVSTPGDYSQVFPAGNGCDSTHTLTLLEVGDTVEVQEVTSICQGESYLFFGSNLTAAGSYHNYDNSAGCTVHTALELSVLDTFFVIENIAICQGEMADIFGVPASMAGTYQMFFAAQNGCDSTHTINLTVLDTTATSEIISICENETADVFGNLTNLPGSYSQTFQNANGCDSTHTITLVVNDTFLLAESVSICQGDSAFIFGNWEKQAGTFTQVFTTSSGCDSTVTVELLVNPVSQTSESLTICENETAVIFGTPTNVPGIYSQTFQTIAGCDSTHTIELVVLDTAETSETIVICENEMADIFGNMTNVAGAYSQVFQSYNGCDSTHTITLFMNDTLQTSENIYVCFGDSVLVFGNWETVPGIYTQAFQMANGCDSTHSVLLIAGSEIFLNFETTTGCGNTSDGAVEVIAAGGVLPLTYMWNVPGQTGNTITGLPPGFYEITVTDANGCTAGGGVELEAIENLNLQMDLTGPSCFGKEDGSLSVSANLTDLLYSLDGVNFETTTVWEGISAGNYTLFVQNVDGCEWEFPFDLEEPVPVFVQLPSDITIELGETIVIQATTFQDSLQFAWFPGEWLSCNNCQSPEADPKVTTLYTLMAFDQNGCEAMDSILITVEFTNGVYVPNAFSPNGDGINDFFYIQGKGISEVRILRVFDRWGELVFERENALPNESSFGWNGIFKGKKMNPAVFAWYAELEMLDGTIKVLKGDVTLLY